MCYGYFACKSVHHVHTVPTEARRGHQIPLKLELTHCESVDIKPKFSERVARTLLTTEPFSSPENPDAKLSGLALSGDSEADS